MNCEARVSADTNFHYDAEAAFQLHRSELTKLLPFAEIVHIGSTAVLGALTKGDLDILVRVVTPESLARADEILARIYERNSGSDKNEEFSSFKNDAAVPPLGIQVALKGSRYDRFVIFRDRLRNSESLLQEFNDLKLRFNGKSMEEYRRAKAEFVQRAIKD